MNKKLTKVLVCCSMLSSFSVLAGCGKTSDTILIGVSGPLTGPASAYGTAVQHSAQMAVDEINAAGGVNGYNLELLALDDKHDATNVSTNYATMVSKNVKVSLGTVTTKPGLEFKELSKQGNMFFITPSASADAIPEYANGYQMCFADTRQGTYSAKYVNDNISKESKIGALYLSGDDYSEGIFNNFKSNLDPEYDFVYTSFSESTPTDLSSQVTILKDCDFIFLPIYYTPASTFMTQAKGFVANDAVYFGCDGLDGIDSAIEGFDISTIPQEVSYLSHFNSKATSGAAKEYIDKYKAAYGADTLNQFGASAYDCVYAISQALKEIAAEDPTKVTPDVSTSDYCENLKAKFQNNFTFSGVTGTNITWDSNGYVDKAATKYVVKEKD